MKIVEWNLEEPAATQLRSWCRLAAEPGVLLAQFVGQGGSESLGWKEVERWTRSRAVTVAEVMSSISSPALDVALCADLVYLHPGVEVAVGPGEPSAGLLWALGRAGRAALARGLLDRTPLVVNEAVRLGLAQRALEIGETPLVSDEASLVALTIARDLMRSSVSARPALEHAAFRLLFASGDPVEGARSFFEQRPPNFTG